MKSVAVALGLGLWVAMFIACAWWWGREYGRHERHVAAEVNIPEDVNGVIVDNYAGVYDPNDPAYKYIPEADPTWIEKFGASERTRLLHSISELRFVVAAQGRRIMALEDPNEVPE
jgi:hypothetical protein